MMQRSAQPLVSRFLAGWRERSRLGGQALALVAAAAITGPAAAQYQLVWEDQFDGNSLDPTRWEPMIGTGCPNLCGWGNNELQYYRAENATVGGGLLTITARQQNFGGAQYTSARLRTRGLGEWKYGRFEMRAKMPIGRGLWPAFWMLPTDSAYGVWAASGEIDVMEYVGQDPSRVLGTIHYGGTFPGNVFSGGGYTLPSGNFNEDFHTFAVEWDETEIRWYVDGVLYSTKTSWWSSGGPYPAPFDERFHLLLNMAVGGNLPGPPNASTVFPQTFEIDYVRVYQLPDATSCAAVFDDMEHADPNSSGYFTFNGPSSLGSIGASTTDLPPAEGGSASLAASWISGGGPGFLGGFGRTNPANLSGRTHFEMWIRPDAGQDFTLEINLQDDDNGDNQIPGTPDGADDEFQYSLRVSPIGPDVISGGGWQRVSIPLSSFVDDNSFHTGGNGVLDPVPSFVGGNGQLVNVVLAIVSNNGADASFRTDGWTFSRRSSSIAGRVFSDENGDGPTVGEAGIDGVTVELVDPVLGQVVAQTTTAFLGNYGFAELAARSYTVRVDTSTLPAGATATFDPDGVGSSHEFTLELACDEVVTVQDFGYEPASIGVRVCAPAVTNSTGQAGRIRAAGSLVAGDNDLTLVASRLPAGSLGYFIVSASPGFITNPGGSTGHLCLLPPFGRYVPFAAAVAADGTMLLPIDLTTIPQPTSTVSVAPGESWYFQLWHRDSAVGIPTSNFTDAVGVTFQ